MSEINCWDQLKSVRQQLQELIKLQSELVQKCTMELYQTRVMVISRRERQVIDLFSSHPEFGNKQVAYELNISERTVKMHMGSLFRKYGVNNRQELLSLANRGMI